MEGFEPSTPYLILLTTFAFQHLFQLTFECFYQLNYMDSFNKRLITPSVYFHEKI